MLDVLIASNNPGKVTEMCQLLALYGWHGRSYQSEHAAVTFPKELSDYRANAYQKVTFIQKLLQTSLPVLGDDSGLKLVAYPELFNEATHRTFDLGTPLSHPAYLLKLLKDRPQAPRSITLFSYLVLGIDTTYYTGTGALNAQVALAKLGTGGFDLDRIIIPDQEHLTLAQMTEDKRQQYQQRHLAMTKLITNVEGGYHENNSATTYRKDPNGSGL